MKVITPCFYHQFSCVAGECTDTCCAGWEIGIDEEALDKYETMEGPFAGRLKNGIDLERGCFYQYDGACCFLNEEKLCDIYCEAGEGYLCDTCKTYPRHEEEYGLTRERSLGLSCPEVARILLSYEDKMAFVENVEEGGGEEGGGEEEFDEELYDFLCEARDVMISLAQDRKKKLSMRMALILALGHDLQKRVESREFTEARKVLSRYQRKEVQRYLEKKIARIWSRTNGTLKGKRRLVRSFGKLTFLNERWEKSYYDTVECLSQHTNRSYGDYILTYERMMEVRYQGVYKEQLLVYFLYTYLCTAAYDEDVFTKVKMAVACTLMIEELNFVTWCRKKRIGRKKLIENAYCFARNLEHLDENLELLERLLAKKSCSLSYFLSLLEN